MQNTPATVGVPRAQALSTGPVLLTWLNGNLGDLQAQQVVKVKVMQNSKINKYLKKKTQTKQFYHNSLILKYVHLFAMCTMLLSVLCEM